MNKVLVLSDFYPKEDCYAREPYSSWRGGYIKRYLSKTGIMNYKLDYLFDCYIPDWKRNEYVDQYNQVKAESMAVELYTTSLDNKIKQTNPNVIVCFSKAVFNYLTGLTPHIHRGTTTTTTKKYNGREIKVILTVEMDIVAKDYKQHYTVLRDLRKVSFESNFPEVLEDTRVPIVDPDYTTAVSVLEGVLKNKDIDVIAYDVETIATHLSYFGFAWSKDHAIAIKFLNGSQAIFTLEQEVHLTRLISELLETKKIVAHNMSYDNSIMLKNQHIFVKNCYMDTMIAAHCLLPEAAGTEERKVSEATKKKQGLGLSLGYLSSIYLNVPAWKHTSAQDKGLYNALDCVNTFRLYEFFKEELHKHNLWHILELKMKELEISMLLQHLGMPVDKEKMEKLKIKNILRVERFQAVLDKWTGMTINYNSSKQVCDLLYSKLELPVQLNKEKRPTADASAIDKLIKQVKDKNKKAILKVMAKRTSLHTLQKSFLNLNLDQNDKVHTSFNVVGTSFSRWNSSGSIIYPYGNGEGGKINLQNIPYYVRQIYIPSKKNYLIGSLDFVQAEAVIVAHYTQDERSIKIFKENFGKPKEERIDFHIENAKRFFPNQKITKALRDLGKKCSHAANYDVGPWELARGMNCTVREATKNLNDIHAAKPEIRRWHAKVQAEVRQTGCLVNAFGRKHLFLDRHTDPKTGKFNLKTAYAYLPQSTIGDLLHYGSGEFYDLYGARWNIWTELHDALYVEFHRDDLDDWVKAMKACFIRKFKILGSEVLVDIDLSVGENWRDQKEINIY